MFSINKLSRDRRVQILAALVEGNSIASTCRMTGAAKNTVLKLLGDAGFACFEYQDRTLRGLTSKNIQCDEIWAFVGAKAKHVPAESRGEYGFGDVWMWTALDSDSKLIVSWLVANRSAGAANAFMQDVAERLTNRVQMTTDGYVAYLNAVEGAFGADIDYAQLIKQYGEDPSAEKRYSPAVCTGTETRIHTSYVERQNLTMRMGMRRMTRLTNAFSKKVENLEHAVSLHFMYHNFCRKHLTLKGRTPAMAAGVADRVWTVADIVDLIDEAAADFVIG
jgi:IS1 family transposase